MPEGLISGYVVPAEALASSVVCLNGVLSTTRRNLLHYPRHVYDAPPPGQQQAPLC